MPRLPFKPFWALSNPKARALAAGRQPLRYFDGIASGRSTGVPGAVVMLHKAHQDYGKLKWGAQFEEAITLAENGFEVSPRMADIVARMSNPRALLEGELAEKIIAAVREEPLPGTLSLSDMAAYQPKKTQALCSTYRAHIICGAQPPASGGIAVQSNAAITDIKAGNPAAFLRGKDATPDSPGTSHFTIVDKDGLTVSMTTTVEAPFGSQRMAGGFMLKMENFFSPRVRPAVIPSLLIRRKPLSASLIGA